MPSSTNKVAFIFPGQGSQMIGMGRDLAEEFPIAYDVFKQADELLSFSLSRIAWEGPKVKINDTVYTQPALLVHSIAVLRVFKNIFPEIQPHFIAGHSLGEFSALVASGSLSFEDALILVKERGELMKRAGEVSPGCMVAILGLDILTVEEICIKVSTDDDVVQVAIDNCEGQVVISGSKVAIDNAIHALEKIGARRVIPLAVSIASHSPLMAKVQNEFSQIVKTFSIVQPRVPIIGNVTACSLNSVKGIRNELETQLTSRVRWRETIQYLNHEGVNTFIEMGSGNVLTGILRRICKEAIGISLSNPKDFEHLEPFV